MILLIGPGAVGTVLATHLAAAKRLPLKLYVRERSLAAMQAVSELRVDRPGKTPPLQAARPGLTTQLDLHGVRYLFLCVKYPDLDALLLQLPPVPADCTLVSTLNGIAPLRLIRERLPRARIVPMTVMFNGQLLSPLHARITTKAQVLIGSDDDTLLGAFEGSGLQTQRADGDSAVWGKLLINLANAVCAITHTTFRDLLSNDDLRAIYVRVLDEAVGLLDVAGVPYQLHVPLPYPWYRQFILHGGPLPWWVAKIKNGLRDGAYPSMVADVEQGRRTEVDQLNGEVLRLAQAQNMAAPVNAGIVEQVHRMERGAQPPSFLTPKELRLRLGG
ncbi:MAG: ketopantoate reductase family protein [Nevskiaceae bacterium]|nr:MAG: ketopantoate reductase family protein [Nevskiaceae bacterium]